MAPEGVALRMTAAQILELVCNLPPRFSSSLQLELESKKTGLVGRDTKTRLSLSQSDIAGLVLRMCGEADLVSHLEEHQSAADLGSDQLPHLALCLLLGSIPSLPDLCGLTIGGLPGGTGVEAGEQALEVLCEALLSQRWSSGVRHLGWCADALGTERACGHLGQLLRSGFCKLESLELYHTGMRADGMRHIAEALETNTSLSKLLIRRCPVGDTGVQLLGTMLGTNSTLQELTLRNIGMTGEGAHHLCDALAQAHRPMGLKTLNIYCNKGMGQQLAAGLGTMLAQNRSLHKLDVSYCHLEDEEGHLLEGLRSNSTLEELDISENNLSKRALTLFVQCVALHNTLRALTMRWPGEMPAAEELAAMISTNQSLKVLDIQNAPYSASDWATFILPALAQNETLQSIDIKGCPGIDGDEVVAAFFQLLQVNTVIESIDLLNTPLAYAGKSEAVNEELRLNRQFRHTLSAMPTTHPKSCRLVLCGREYAGKSTLFQTMKLLHAERITLYQQIKLHGQQVWRKCFGQSSYNKELSKRTSGIDIHLLKDEEDFRISVWDFAGHREFHALHDFMFPSGDNAATLFVFTYSPIESAVEDRAGQVKTQQRLKDEFLYWLKFIASNSKATSAKPSVVVVITNKDRLSSNLKNVDIWLSGAQDTITELAAEFRDLVDVWSEPFFVNALAKEDAEMRRWMNAIEKALETTLHGLQKEPAICNEVVKALGAPRRSPIISVADFANICLSLAKSQAGLSSADMVSSTGDKVVRAVAGFLHNAGDIIYHDKLNFILQNPRWFGHGVLGHLIDLFSEGSKSSRALIRDFFTCCSEPKTGLKKDYLPKNAFISRKSLNKLLHKALQSVPGMDPDGVQPDELIQLMLLLDLCYEQNPGDPETGYLLPAIFDDEDFKAANGKRPWKWRNWKSSSNLERILAGRRLECADPQRTFLTDGFFPRLQVVLYNQAVAENWVTQTDSDICILEKNVFSILVNGMEIIVEYSGLSGYFVDILVKSSQSHQETMEFVHRSFIGTVRSFCASREGCQGVTLQEAIIRPACLHGAVPTLCAYRKDQAISVEELQRRMARIPNYEHSWGEVKDEAGRVVLPAGADSPKLLLDGETPPSPAGALVVVTPAGGLTSPRRIFLTSEDVPLIRKLAVKSRLGRVVPFQFHLQCECSHGGEHPVEAQPGRTFYVVDKRFALEQRIRMVSVGSAASVLKGAGAVVPSLGAAGDVLSGLPLFSGTPVYCDTIDFLSERITGKASAIVSDEELRVEVEMAMQTSSAGAWMEAFLNPSAGFMAFRDDFLLKNVEYLTSSSAYSTAWLCDEHCKEGLDQGTLKRIL